MRSPGAGPDAADRWAAKLTPTAAPVPEGTPADVPTAGGLFRCDETNHAPNKTGALSKSSPPYGRAHYAHPRTYSRTAPTGSTTAGPTSGSRRPLFLRNAADTPPAVSNNRNKGNNRNTILEHLRRIAGGLNRRPVFHFGKQRISETPPGHFAKARISETPPTISQNSELAKRTPPGGAGTTRQNRPRTRPGGRFRAKNSRFSGFSTGRRGLSTNICL